jgi:hypothetical protein
MGRKPNYEAALPRGMYERLGAATKNKSILEIIKKAEQIGTIIAPMASLGPQPVGDGGPKASDEKLSPPADQNAGNAQGVTQDTSQQAVDKMSKEQEEKGKEANPSGNITAKAKNNNWWGDLDEWEVENKNWSPYIGVLKVREKLSDITGKMGKVMFHWDEDIWTLKAIDSDNYVLGVVMDSNSRQKSQKDMLDECEIKVFGDISTSGDIYDPNAMHNNYVEERKIRDLQRKEREKNKDK